MAESEFEKLKRHLPAVTKEHFRDVFQISQVTYYRLRDGHPVADFVVRRLRARLEALDERQGTHG